MKDKVESFLFETICHISEFYALANSETSNMQLKRVHLEDFFDWVDTYCDYCEAFYAIGIFTEEEKDNRIKYVYEKFM